jgi:quercetin dioxygenase-like cupin family protein
MNQNILRGLATATTLCALAIPGIGGELPAGAVALTPSQLTWKPGRVPGVENAALLGSSKTQGPYIERVRFPPNFVIQAHTHPDQRSYTILSGTWYIGYGDNFDETKLQSLPPGSFYVEPAGVNHFVATKDEPVVLQLTGMGPTATQFLDKAKAPAPTK